LIPLPTRRGDSAKMTKIEWVEEIVEKKKNENVPTESKRSK